MLSGKALQPRLTGNSHCARAHAVVRAQAGTSTVQVTKGEAKASSKDKIYIGHVKDDYEGKRSGVPGRFISDDPNKYPGRDGWLTGGWAGGEAGLQRFVQEASSTQPAPYSKLTNGKAPKPIGKGSDPIYIGHPKDDYEGKRTGNQGRVIKDDARKYPERNELTGGFAGGELGLKKFVELGDVPIAEPGSRGRGQGQSPLFIAGLLGGAATVGGLLLFDVAETGEQALQVSAPSVAVAGLDDNTKLLLQAAVVLAGLTGVVAGGRAVVGAAANSVKESAIKLGTLAVFWVSVFLAAQFVLSSP
ncbi:hypothetical protein N2152v2_006006 [Parachlorella kessleri]